MKTVSSARILSEKRVASLLVEAFVWQNLHRADALEILAFMLIKARICALL